MVAMVLRYGRVHRGPAWLKGNIVALLVVESRVEAVRLMAFPEHGVARRQRLIVLHVTRIRHLWQWR